MENTATAALVGNLTRDPRGFAEGSVCRFGLGVTVRVKDDGEWRDESNWYEIVCFGRLAARALGFLKKGEKVCVTGLLRTVRTESQGKPYVSVEVVAQTLEPLSPPQKNEPGEQDEAIHPPPEPEGEPQPVGDFGGWAEAPF